MQVVLYPNPAADYLRLRVTSTASANAFTITLYDAMGHLARTWQAAASARYDAEIALDSLPAGAYYLQIEAGGHRCVKSFSVLH